MKEVIIFTASRNVLAYLSAETATLLLAERYGCLGDRLAALAAQHEPLQSLARHAVASMSVPQSSEFGTRVADASFLVEREKWSSFRDAVREERERSPSMAMEESGPWPAYDFVRLQFGG